MRPAATEWGPLAGMRVAARGAYLRTVENPVWSRIFVQCIALHALVLVGISVAVAVLESDCHFSLLLSLASMTTLFMSYFALEAVRTENVYQCAFPPPPHAPPARAARALTLRMVPSVRLVAYGLTSLAFLIGFLPPLLGAERGTVNPPADPSRDTRVRALMLIAVAVACAMHGYAPPHTSFMKCASAPSAMRVREDGP